jgi:hypothetical protein
MMEEEEEEEGGREVFCFWDEKHLVYTIDLRL